VDGFGCRTLAVFKGADFFFFRMLLTVLSKKLPPVTGLPIGGWRTLKTSGVAFPFGFGLPALLAAACPLQAGQAQEGKGATLPLEALTPGFATGLKALPPLRSCRL
jgi:hypothetical protein